MQNQEYLLTNYYLIYEMINVGFSIKEIQVEINKILNTQITYRQLRYLISRVQNRSIHREYNNIVMINTIDRDTDTQFCNYSVNFKGLLITYKSALNPASYRYIVAPHNLLDIPSKESLLYAKRLLKMYIISDQSLLKKHALIYPNLTDIDLEFINEKIHISFNDEFNIMKTSLRDKYVNFLTKNILEKINI